MALFGVSTIIGTDVVCATVDSDLAANVVMGYRYSPSNDIVAIAADFGHCSYIPAGKWSKRSVLLCSSILIVLVEAVRSWILVSMPQLSYTAQLTESCEIR